jgi:hypothetical protein
VGNERAVDRRSVDGPVDRGGVDGSRILTV